MPNYEMLRPDARTRQPTTRGRRLMAWMFYAALTSNATDEESESTSLMSEEAYFSGAEDNCPYEPKHLPPIRSVDRAELSNFRKTQLKTHVNNDLPVAPNKWGRRYGKGEGHRRKGRRNAEGGSISDSTLCNYSGHFRQWEVRRGINGVGPYIGEMAKSTKTDEDSARGYMTSALGPLEKGHPTATGRLGANGYYRKMQTGVHLLWGMHRVHLAIKGIRRAKGPTARKPPIAIGEMRAVMGVLDFWNMGREIPRRTRLMGGSSFLGWANI